MAGVRGGRGEGRRGCDVGGRARLLHVAQKVDARLLGELEDDELELLHLLHHLGHHRRLALHLGVRDLLARRLLAVEGDERVDGGAEPRVALQLREHLLQLRRRRRLGPRHLHPLEEGGELLVQPHHARHHRARRHALDHALAKAAQHGDMLLVPLAQRHLERRERLRASAAALGRALAVGVVERGLHAGSAELGALRPREEGRGAGSESRSEGGGADVGARSRGGGSASLQQRKGALGVGHVEVDRLEHRLHRVAVSTVAARAGAGRRWGRAE